MFATLPVLSIVSQPFKRSQLGLFQGKTKQYGNNVPFSKHKTRRTWLPNVQRKKLHSQTLGEDVRVKLTTRALRTIKKHGGLDQYVERTSHKVLGWEGMRIRLMIREGARTPATATTAITNGEKGKASGAITTSPTEDEGPDTPQQLMRSAKPSVPKQLTARSARQQAMKALGLVSPPNARATIAYLKQQRELLASPTSTSEHQ